MIIKPLDRTIQDTLAGGFYRIPRFQRPYSWDKENVDDFWTDAIVSEEKDYFIGSFVVYKEHANADAFMVVDGQQRLTTLTLLFAAIRNAFHDLKDTGLAAAVQKLIERTDINNQSRFVLQTETSYPYLQEYIQKYGAPALPKSVGREEEALELAFVHVRSRLESELTYIDLDPKVTKADKVKTKLARLVQLRNNALRLQVIVVELQKEDEAYQIFETLNTRGKDLGVADLVKNLLTRLLKPSNKGVDVARDKWQAILEVFDESAASLDINSFIYHAWLSRSPYTGKDTLFRKIRGYVTKSTVSSFLDNLVKDSRLYRQVLEPSSWPWTKQEIEIVESLKALTIFRVLQPLPMVLAILRGYREKVLTAKQVRQVLRKMEDFHVQFTALTAQRTGGGTARMYASSAEALTKASTPGARSAVLNEFKKKMIARRPTQQEFEAGFHQITFSSGNTKDKALVQYLLRRLDQHHRSGPPLDYSQMTIEHIAPENPSGTATASSTHGGKLGNLILLDQKFNDKVGNKDFTAKKALYKTAGVPMDTTLKKATKWSDTEIDARSSALAQLSYSTIFAI